MSEISELSQNLAQNIVSLRKLRGITQERLSKLSGIPRSTITHFESGGGNPSLINLSKIAKALEIKVEELLANPFHEKTQLVRNDELNFIEKGNCTIYNLIPSPIKGLNIERFELEGENGFSGVPHLPGTKEYFTCIQGKAEVVVAGEKYLLSKGDTLIFKGNEKHSYRNPTNKKSMAISIIYNEN